MIRELRLPDGGMIFVEITDEMGSLPRNVAEHLYQDSSLPDDTRLTGISDATSIAGQLLKAQIAGLAAIAVEALKDLGPKELQIEAHIKFEGDVKIIPYIASAKGDGGLKIAMKWVF